MICPFVPALTKPSELPRSSGVQQPIRPFVPESSGVAVDEDSSRSEPLTCPFVLLLVDYRWTKTWKALGYGGLTIDNFNQVIGDLR